MRRLLASGPCAFVVARGRTFPSPEQTDVADVHSQRVVGRSVDSGTARVCADYSGASATDFHRFPFLITISR